MVRFVEVMDEPTQSAHLSLINEKFNISKKKKMIEERWILLIIVQLLYIYLLSRSFARFTQQQTVLQTKKNLLNIFNKFCSPILSPAHQTLLLTVTTMFAVNFIDIKWNELIINVTHSVEIARPTKNGPFSHFLFLIPRRRPLGPNS